MKRHRRAIARQGTPVVSCLMPVYNSSRYLRESITSILDQDFSSFEFIVVDDGSTDDTWIILEEFASKHGRIKLLKQANTGIVGALNNGLRLCRGEFIARMDGDDISKPERFRLQVEFLRNYDDVVAVGSLYDIIDSGGNLKMAQARYSLVETTDYSRFPIRPAVIQHSSAMIRRSSLNQVGGYRVGFDYAEDYDLWLRLGRLGRIATIDRSLLMYRVHDSSSSSRFVIAQEVNAVRAELSALLSKRVGGSNSFAAEESMEKMGEILNLPPSILNGYLEERIWKKFHRMQRHDLANRRWRTVFFRLFGSLPESGPYGTRLLLSFLARTVYYWLKQLGSR